MIPYSRQDINDADVAAVAAALREPLITQGLKVAEFEARLAQVTGSRFAVGFSSGTAALHAAYAAAGVCAGKSIVTSPITFAATANAALYLQAGVRFADVDSKHAMLSPDLVEAVDDRDVAVVVPVHLAGHVGQVERLARIAQTRRWVVVEDAAHALGARYLAADGSEHVVGACDHSDMCCFSFHAVKHITTGEGGAVTTNDQILAAKLRRFRTHGMTRDVSELEHNDGAWYYEQLDLGFNYRITDFQCALGLSQLDRLSVFVQRRRAIAAIYDSEFAGVPGLTTLRPPSGSRSSYHLYVLRVPAAVRRRVFEGLRSVGVGVNVHYIPVYRHPYYRRHGFEGLSLSKAEQYYSEAVTIPLFPGLGDDAVLRIAEQVRQQVKMALR